jgi:hypothetical protein
MYKRGDVFHSDLVGMYQRASERVLSEEFPSVFENIVQADPKQEEFC